MKKFSVKDVNCILYKIKDLYFVSNIQFPIYYITINITVKSFNCFIIKYNKYLQCNMSSTLTIPKLDLRGSVRIDIY